MRGWHWRGGPLTFPWFIRSIVAVWLRYRSAAANTAAIEAIHLHGKIHHKPLCKMDESGTVFGKLESTFSKFTPHLKQYAKGHVRRKIIGGIPKSYNWRIHPDRSNVTFLAYLSETLRATAYFAASLRRWQSPNLRRLKARWMFCPTVGTGSVSNWKENVKQSICVFFTGWYCEKQY